MFHPSTLRRFLRLCALSGFFLIPLVFFTPFKDQFELPKLVFCSLLAFPIALGRLLDPVRRRINSLEALVAALLALQAISSLPGISSAPRTSLIGEYENFGGWLTSLTFAAWFYGLGIGRPTSELRKTFFFVATAAFLSALYALFQTNGLDFVLWNPETYSANRVFASLGNPNFLAAFLAMALPLVFVQPLHAEHAAGRGLWISLPLSLILLVMATGRFAASWAGGSNLPPALAGLAGFCLLSASWIHPKMRVGVLAPWAGVALLGSGLVATGSRGGWLGAVAGLILLGGLYWKNRSERTPRTVFLILGCVVLCVTVVGSPFFTRLGRSLAHPMESLAQSRLTIWKPAVRMIQDHPLTGVGLDCFKLAFTSYSRHDFNAQDGTFVSSRTAHNEWLQAAATCGLPSLVALLILTGLFYKRVADRWKTSSGMEKPLWAATAAASTAFLVQNLFSFSVSVLSLLWSLLLASVNRDETQGEGPRPKLFVAVLFLSSLFALPVGLRLAADRSFAGGMAYLDYLKHPNRALTPEQTDFIVNRADAAIHRASRLFPTEVKYLLYRGMAMEKSTGPLGLENALAIYDQTIRWVPTNAYYHNNRARILLAMARRDGRPPHAAEESLRIAVKYAPENPFFLSQWGSCLLVLNRASDAQGPLDRAFGLDAALSAETVAQIGYDTNRSGDHRGADALFSEALRRNPESAKARFLKGWAAWQAGRKKEARADFDEAVRLNPELAEVRAAILNEI